MRPRTTHPSQTALLAEAKRQRKIRLRTRLVKTLYFIPLVNALSAASQSMLGARSIGWQRRSIIMVALLSFTSELGLGHGFTFDGMRDLLALAQTGRLPPDSLPLSQRKRFINLIASALIAGYAAFSNTILTYEFAKELPLDLELDIRPTQPLFIAFCITLACTQGLGDIFSEGISTYKAISEFLSTQNVAYTNTPSKWVSNLVGSMLGALHGLGDTIGGIYIIDTLQPGNQSQVIALSSLSLLNGLSDYTQNGRDIRDAINQMFAYLIDLKNNARLPHAEPVIAFTPCSIASIIVAAAWRGLMSLMIYDALVRFDMDSSTHPNPLVEASSIGMAISQYVITLNKLFPAILSLTQYGTRGMLATKRRIHDCLNPPILPDTVPLLALEQEDTDDELNETMIPANPNPYAVNIVNAAFWDDDPLPLAAPPLAPASNPNRFFNRAQTALVAQPPRLSRTRCSIL